MLPVLILLLHAANGRAVEPDVQNELSPFMQKLIEKCSSNDLNVRFCNDVRSQIGNLRTTLRDRPAETESLLEQASTQFEQTSQLIDRLRWVDYQAACDLQELRYALYRRMKVWRLAAQLDRTSGFTRDEGIVVGNQIAGLSESVALVDSLLGNSTTADDWRDYLLMKKLKIIGSTNRTIQKSAVRRIFIEATEHIDCRTLAPNQLALLEKPEIQTLRACMERWLIGSVDSPELIDSLERFEETGTQADSLTFSDTLLVLEMNENPRLAESAHEIRLLFSNANLRMEVTDKFLNRLPPPRDPEFQEVSERVAGQPVKGHSWTDTKVGFQMVPSSEAAQFALVIRGNVTAVTSASSTGATFLNDTHSSYVGTKLIRIDNDHLQLFPAEVQVDNEVELRKVQTRFDAIPVLGNVVSNYAKSEHQKTRPRINAELERKVYLEAKHTIDAEANKGFTELNALIAQFFFCPLENLNMRPEVFENRTTSDRFMIRYRIAAPRQLGSFSPRPSPPIESLASVQIHQSMINNIIAQLDIGGKTFTVAELRTLLAETFNIPLPENTADENDDVRIRFMSSDPIYISFEDGMVHIHLGIDLLGVESQEWKSFRVHAQYVPRSQGAAIFLERDGVVNLNGSLNASSQIALRGIFSKIFSNDTPIRMSSEIFQTDKRFAGLWFAPCHADGGWFSIAMMPEQYIAGTLPDIDSRQAVNSGTVGQGSEILNR